MYHFEYIQIILNNQADKDERMEENTLVISITFGLSFHLKYYKPKQKENFDKEEDRAVLKFTEIVSDNYFL